MRVLEYGELEDLRVRYGRLNAVEPLPVPDLTHPAVVLSPHRDARLSGDGGGLDVTLNQRGTL
jgi:anaerobic dimethyl sulfoxide reductase subunit B